MFVLSACHQSNRDKEAKEQRERDERFDATLQHFTSQHSAVRLDTREPNSIFRKLTIDAQDSIAATPSQLYWSISDQFDIYRDASGPRLFFRAISDHWVSLSCTDAQVAAIRKQCRPDRTFCILRASVHTSIRFSAAYRAPRLEFWHRRGHFGSSCGGRDYRTSVHRRAQRLCTT